MALTRKFLSALGIEADKIDEIIEAHVDTVNALKSERDDYKAKAEKTDEVQKQLDEATKKLSDNSADGLKKQYDDLKSEYETYKAEQETKATKAAKEAAYKALLKATGVSEKRLDSIMKVTNLDSLEMDGDKLKDAEKLTESVKKEWADFITTTQRQGAGTETPPPGADGSGDYETMTMAEYAAARKKK